MLMTVSGFRCQDLVPWRLCEKFISFFCDQTDHFFRPEAALV
ncbi:hypothetical protein D1AOALGA4SA_6415 [Olavius algarvensis Delta 1 endosymbiont]|nr:hypothetical protein D1AOALGA4SA_6415 [Olavius algarvensis Delta 1 endosymbiont]